MTFTLIEIKAEKITDLCDTQDMSVCTLRREFQLNKNCKLLSKLPKRPNRHENSSEKQGWFFMNLQHIGFHGTYLGFKIGIMAEDKSLKLKIEINLETDHL